MEQLNNRLFALLDEENKQPEGWWYLSWADEVCSLGAAVVRGRGLVTAMLTALSFGIAPGGELLAIPLGTDEADLPAPRFRNRLLNPAEVDAAYAHRGGGGVLDGNLLQ